MRISEISILIEVVRMASIALALGVWGIRGPCLGLALVDFLVLLRLIRLPFVLLFPSLAIVEVPYYISSTTSSLLEIILQFPKRYITLKFRAASN